jgi:hypothetical protein
MSTTYTLKFFKGRKLIVEQAFPFDFGGIDEIPEFAREVAYDCGQMIDEAIITNPPEERTVESCD